MTLSRDLWGANQDLVGACLKHPFVQGIASGTLPRERFVYYVGQDAFYLEAFARAYSIAGVKAPDWEGFLAFHALADGALEERRLHESYARESRGEHRGAEAQLVLQRLLQKAWLLQPRGPLARRVPAGCARNWRPRRFADLARE